MSYLSYRIRRFIARHQGKLTALFLFLAYGFVGYLETLPY